MENTLKRLIFFVGVHDTLDIFSYELEKEYRRRGYETLIFHTDEMKKSLDQLSKFIEKPVKAMITFNNLGFNMELVPGKNIWDELGIPCINILMDHPFCYKKALDEAPKRAIVLCPDRNHMKYLQRFYPQIPIVGYLPHGGLVCDPEDTYHTGLSSNDKFVSHLEHAHIDTQVEADTPRYKKITERSIDVIYAGGLSREFAKNVMPDFSVFTKFDGREIGQLAYDMLIQEPNQTTEAAIEKVLKAKKIVLTEEELCDVIAKLHYVDLFATSYYREKVVRTLVEHGIKVLLFGSGWDKCEWLGHPNLTFGGRVSAEEVVKKMQDAKIVLNTMTWFKDGTHDRVFNGMLSGAVAVTDSSIYMKEEFCGSFSQESNMELLMFELNEIDQLPDQVKHLLENPDRMQQIADRGYEKAKAKHTWAARAQELEDDLLSEL